MNWAEFERLIGPSIAEPVPLGMMSGGGYDNATRDVLKPVKGRALDNTFAALFASPDLRGDFVWLGTGAGRVQAAAGASGGHPALMGPRTGYCAGRIEEYGFFFHSGHYHPTLENALPFLIDFIDNSCRTLAAGAVRDQAVDRLAKLALRFYKDGSEKETYFTTFEKLMEARAARLALAPAPSAMTSGAAAAGSSPAPAKVVVGTREGPKGWGMTIPVYATTAATLSGAAAASQHASLTLTKPQPTIALLPALPLTGGGSASSAAIAPAQPASGVGVLPAESLSAPAKLAIASSAAATTFVPPRAMNLGVTATGQFLENLHLARARWVPDGERSACSRCSAAFSAMRWKHHCRKCGFVVCDACSTARAIVHLPASPGNDDVPVTDSAVRVCTVCARRPDL